MKTSRTFLDAIAHRRSYYALKNESPISDDAIREIVECTIKHVPSPFNSQSARLVVLRSEHHQKVRELTKDVLRLVL